MINYMTAKDIDKYLLQFDIDNIETKSSKKVEYYNIPSTFDIETSSTYYDFKEDKIISAKEISLLKEKRDNFDTERYEKFAFMYIWQLSIDDKIIIGRTWEEFENCFNKISDYFKLGDERKLIIYVRNLSFEFNFIRKHLKFDKVFATEPHKVLYAETTNGFTFKCSYFLSNASLETTGKNLVKYKAEKKTGDLDYNLIRHSNTPLSETEMEYCLYDVIVDSNFIRESMESEKGKSIVKIPLTKTGYVRRYCRKKCLDRIGLAKYTDILREFDLNEKIYFQLKRAFSGGFTHSNAINTGKIFENVVSKDFTSSYPAVLLTEKFPIKKIGYYNPKSLKDFIECIKTYSCLFDIEFFNIRQKENVYEGILSESKCFKKEHATLNNGRVVDASMVATTITDIDFQSICKFYKFDTIKVSNLILYEKDYLPKKLLDCVIEFYKGKTTLKDVEDKVVEYGLAKGMLNAIFGMMVTDPVHDTIIYNEGWDAELENIEIALTKFNNSRSRFLAYEWGVWCTSYARANLFTAILELGGDFIYADTDSVKFVNEDKHKEYFTEYNVGVINKLRNMALKRGYSASDVAPKTIKGVTKTIGLWDDDGVYKRFKTLGAKRYMVEYPDGTINLTVSGINKKMAVPYLIEESKRKACDVFDLFDDELYVDSEHCGKLLHTYIDKEITHDVKDYLGNTLKVTELSSIHLEPVGYSLSITEAYKRYLEGIESKFQKGA